MHKHKNIWEIKRKRPANQRTLGLVPKPKASKIGLDDVAALVYNDGICVNLAVGSVTLQKIYSSMGFSNMTSESVNAALENHFCLPDGLQH